MTWSEFVARWACACDGSPHWRARCLPETREAFYLDSKQIR